MVGLDYPPRDLHLRGYKLERRLEVWARPAGKPAPAFVLVSTLPILGLSGVLGPKRREGDLQVPEGFYRVDRFNPRSLFYLSLGLNYPNESDRLLAADPAHPGTDIFIHGGERSRGCLAIGDEAMAWLYLAALDTVQSSKNQITMHLFPAQMDTPEQQDRLSPLARASSELCQFWEILAAADRLFRETRQPIAPEIGPDGRYLFRCA